MPPPAIHDDADDDRPALTLYSLDDLDDVLDSLTRPAASTLSSSAASKATPPASAPPPPPQSSSSSFPDPDDDALPDPDDVELDPDMARQLEQGMQALLANLRGGGGGTGAGGGSSSGPDLAGGLPGLDEQEFTKMMQEMLKGDFGGAGTDANEAGPEAGAGGDDELQKLMAALGISENDLAGLTGASDSAGPNGATASNKARSVNNPSTRETTAAAPANFQDAIAASMSKLRDSSTTADASRNASSSGGDSAGMAAMLAQLAGMPGGAGGLEGLDSDEGLQGMLDDMMKQLMSREMLYEPLKELADKYPAYLTAHSASLSTSDRDRYEKQRVIVSQIVAAFEEPGADYDPATEDKAPVSPEEEKRRAERTERVVELVAKMNECGAPPSEIMGEMPPGMELGPDGAPKVPECSIC